MISEPIHWARISRAISYYRSQGFVYIETPWVVSLEASQVTFPDPHSSNTIHVGSAEQGFIELMLQGKLHSGRYVSAGPCFRPKDADKFLCNPWFFKVELIHVQNLNPNHAEALRELARNFFALEIPSDKPHDLEDGGTPEGWDIYLNGVEIGSYGTRAYRGFEWAYGTGIAEPRFSAALNLT